MASNYPSQYVPDRYANSATHGPFELLGDLPSTTSRAALGVFPPSERPLVSSDLHNQNSARQPSSSSHGSVPWIRLNQYAVNERNAQDGPHRSPPIQRSQSTGSRTGSSIEDPGHRSQHIYPANDHYNRALHEQANALASLSRHRSIGHAKLRYESVREQIRLDEELAHKLSMEELRNVENGNIEQSSTTLRSGGSGSQHPTSNPMAGTGDSPFVQRVGLLFDPNEGRSRKGATKNHSIASGAGHSGLGRNEPVLSPQRQQPAFREVDITQQSQPRPHEIRALPVNRTIERGPRGHERIPSLNLPNTPLRDCPTPVAARAICKQCECERDGVSFCPVCAINYCEEHWKSQPLHQQPQENQRSMYGVPHERTDPNLVERILSIIEPTASEQEQQQMHLDDDNTSWFGVLADSAGELYFHDWGRYEEFLAQSRAGSKGVQFPGLISFVGPTGAGKSTIVKALVKLFQKEHKLGSAQAPVVGLTEHQAVPTSGAVHLYWDHDTLFGENPLLFADCEGLGGGSREPMSERAASSKGKNVLTKKDKGGRPRAYSRTDSTDNVNQESQESQHRRTFIRSSGHRSSPPPPSYPGRSISPNPRSQNSSYHRASLVEGSLDFSPPSFQLASQTSAPYSPGPEPQARNEGFTPGREKSFRGFTRPLRWATGDKRNRQYIVENLYPRLLYTFSDAVVLVMRNAKQLEGEIERLIGWAAAAIERSSNQPVLPFAIIVLNAADNRINERMLDVSYATQSLLTDLDQTVTKNTAFIKWSQFWHERGRDIYTLKDLLTAFYSDIKVVLIPEKGRPGQVHRQYRVLRDEIQRAAFRSQRRRQRANLLLNSVQFNPYLQIAYEHFSITLDIPFDFIKASSFFYDIAQDRNPVLSLIRACFALWPQDTSQQVLIPLAPLIASAMMLDVIRREIKGDIMTMIPSYQKQLKEALKSFLDEAWPCEALHPKTGQRCVVVQATHKTKGHQLASGKVWSGEYCSSQPVDIQSSFVKRVRNQCQTLWKKVMSDVQAKGLSGTAQEKQIAFEIHQQEIIRGRCDFLHGQRQLVSHSICLCCLYKTPMYPLLCGHVVCDYCFKAAASRSLDDSLLRLYWCPVCVQNWGSGQSCVEAIIKPANAGVRVLSLDGGGIRAIIELKILKLLEQRINFGVPIQEFFDLIVGTSGGGIVALAIGEKNMRIDEAISTFKNFAHAAFKARKGVDLPLLGKIIQLKYQARYETRGLEQSLRHAFGDELLFGGRRQVQSPSRCRVAVTSIDTNSDANLLGNYHRRQITTSLYSFQRWERPEQELKVWEAARATSAAPGFFKGFFKEDNGHTYWDGALRLNNPVFSAEEERHNIWPESSKSMPDILLSLGTGTFTEHHVRSNSDPGPRFGINVIDGARAYVHIGKDLVANGLDCERIWDNFIRGSSFGVDDAQKTTRLHRVNVPILGPKIDLDAVDSMEKLEQITEQYFSRSQNLMQDSHPAQKLDDIAGQLIASLFYFEVQSRVKLTIWGTIKCRLPRALSRESSLARLAKSLIRTRAYRRYFRIFPSTASTSFCQANITDDLLNAILTQGKPFELPLKFDLVDQDIPTIIYLHLDRLRWQKQAISGFPRLVAPREGVSPVPSRVSVGSGSGTASPNLTRLNSDTLPRSITIGGGLGIDDRGDEMRSLATPSSLPVLRQLAASVDEGLDYGPAHSTGTGEQVWYDPEGQPPVRHETARVDRLDGSGIEVDTEHSHGARQFRFQ